MGDFAHVDTQTVSRTSVGAVVGAVLIVAAVVSFLPLFAVRGELPGFQGFLEFAVPPGILYIAVSFNIWLRVIRPVDSATALSVGGLISALAAAYIFLGQVGGSVWVLSGALFLVAAGVGAWAKSQTVVRSLGILDQFMAVNSAAGVGVLLFGLLLALAVKSAPESATAPEFAKPVLVLASDFAGQLGLFSLGLVAIITLGFGAGFRLWGKFR